MIERQIYGDLGFDFEKEGTLNGFSHYYSCITRGTATIEVRDIDTQLTDTYNLESLGSETQGLDNEAAVAAILWKMKEPYYV